MGELKRSLPPVGTLYDVQFNNSGVFDAVTGVLTTDVSGNLYTPAVRFGNNIRLANGTTSVFDITADNDVPYFRFQNNFGMFITSSSGIFWTNGNAGATRDLELKRISGGLLQVSDAVGGYGGLELNDSGKMVNTADNTKWMSWDLSGITTALGVPRVIKAGDFDFDFSTFFSASTTYLNAPTGLQFADSFQYTLSKSGTALRHTVGGLITCMWYSTYALYDATFKLIWDDGTPFATTGDISLERSGIGWLKLGNGGAGYGGLDCVHVAYDDDTAAGAGGLTAGQHYQTTGSGAAPLNVAGIVMVKQ